MVPYADMFNHDRSIKSVSYSYNNTLNGFVMKAYFDIKAGEELFIDYHNMNNT